MRPAEYGFPRRLLLGNPVNRGNPSANLSSNFLDNEENYGLRYLMPRSLYLLHQP
jgi:hypothetical protein